MAVVRRVVAAVAVIGSGLVVACAPADDEEARPGPPVLPASAAASSGGSAAGSSPGTATVTSAGATTTGATTTIATATAATAGQQALDAAVPDGGPGCSAAVGREGQVVWSGVAGLADVTRGDPITPDTTFDIASVSKQFTAAAVLLMARDGTVDLSAPLSAYLTGFPAWADQVTVTDLIHHRSGIPGYIDLVVAQGLDRDDRVTQGSALDVVRAVPTLRADPGTVFDYSDSNYLLLASIVEAVSGEPFASFLATRVFAPAGVSIVLDPVGPVVGGAVPYETVDGTLRDTRDRWEEYGATGVQASPGELVRWADVYRTGVVGGPELVRAMTEDGLVTMNAPNAYGGGLMVNTSTHGFGHPGEWLGFLTTFVVSPDRSTAVAVSCNSSDLDIQSLSRTLATLWIPGA